MRQEIIRSVYCLFTIYILNGYFVITACLFCCRTTSLQIRWNSSGGSARIIHLAPQIIPDNSDPTKRDFDKSFQTSAIQCPIQIHGRASAFSLCWDSASKYFWPSQNNPICQFQGRHNERRITSDEKKDKNCLSSFLILQKKKSTMVSLWGKQRPQKHHRFPFP